MTEFVLGKIKFTWQGNWAVSTVYEKDDIVKYGGNTYVCITGHTSGSAIPDFYTDIAKWNVHVEGVTHKGDHADATYYKINDIVKSDQHQYICTTQHTSTATINLTNFTLYVQGGLVAAQAGKSGQFLSTDGTNTTWVDIVEAAPGALDTLNELAASLADDADFAGTMTTSLAGKEPTLTAGTVAQYYRGDKTWQTLTVDPTMGGDMSGTASNAQIAAGAVDTAEIAAGAVTSNEIAAGAVGTTEIATGTVTNAKMAANSIDSDQYVDGSIDDVHVAAGLDAVKLADGSVTNAELQYINSLSSNAQTQITATTTVASAALPKAGGTMTGEIAAADQVISRPEMKDYSETITALSAAATVDIDITNGNVFTITPDQNTTFTFSNPSPTGKSCSFTLVWTQDSSDRTITWPASLKWKDGGGEPSVTSGSGKVDIYTFFTMDAGTSWYGFQAGADMA